MAALILVTAALAPLLIYPRAFGTEIHPLGPDMFGYVWETRAVGAGPLSLVGTRPGLPVLAAMLSGFRAVASVDASLVVGLVLAITLGLAVAVAVRLAFRLPAWTLGVVAFMVALWGGSVHLSVSYLANELSLVCVALAMTLVALPGRAMRARTAASFASGVAAGLAHPGFLPFFLGVAGLWLLLSIPRLVARTRAGGRWWDDGAVRFLTVLAAASTVTATVVFGAMGLSVSEVTNITDGVRDFTVRLDDVIEAVGLRTVALIVCAAVGVVVAWRMRGPSSGALIRAALAWTAVSVSGAVLGGLDPGFPGHRALLVALPLPAAAGLGLAGLAVWIARVGHRETPSDPARRARRWPRVVAGAVATLVVVGACALAVTPGLARLGRRGAIPARGDPARLVASYIATIDPHVPVVVYSAPTNTLSALSWRGRQNQIRAYGPSSAFANTFVVVATLSGPPDELALVPLEPAGLGPETTYAAKESWRRGGPALAHGAIILVPQAYGAGSTWDTVTTEPARVVAPGLAVLRGPLTPPQVVPARIAIPRGSATVHALLCLMVLAALGAGFAFACARALDGSALDAAALAPAAGAVLLVLVGVGTALTGLDPRGVAGITVASVAALSGYALAWQAQRVARRAPASGA